MEDFMKKEILVMRLTKDTKRKLKEYGLKRFIHNYEDLILSLLNSSAEKQKPNKIMKLYDKYNIQMGISLSKFKALIKEVNKGD